MPIGCFTTRSEKASRAGIGRWVFHNREYLVAVRPLDGVLALHTMRFADELVDAGTLDIPEPSRPRAEREVEMAEPARRVAARRVRPGCVRGHAIASGCSS